MFSYIQEEKQVLSENKISLHSIPCFPDNSNKHNIRRDTSGIYQLKIPFSPEKGVPYIDSESGFIVNGFEVDKKGRLYFMAGHDPSILSCFDKNQEVFRKNYIDISGNKIHSYNSDLYLLDRKFGSNNLHRLSQTDGKVLNSRINITDKKSYYHFFMDSLLILHDFILDKSISLNLEIASLRHNPDKLFKDYVNSIHKPKNFPDEKYRGLIDYLGKWKNYYVYWAWLDDLEILIYDEDGLLKKSRKINTDIFDTILFYDFPLDHVVFKNNNIYHLSKKGNNAVITILPLAGLFPGIN